MILPLLSGYFLFAWIIDYHNDKKIEEYHEVYHEVQRVKEKLIDPALYDPKNSQESVEQVESEHLTITLYTKDGFVLYASPKQPSLIQLVNKNELYRNLYELKQNFRTYTYKEPVFLDNEIVGLFQVHVTREQLMTTIMNRLWIVTSIFILSFIAIYALIALIVHRRINKRLNGLMDEMSAFASGDTREETETGNDEIGELKRHFYTMRQQINDAQKEIAKKQQEKEYMIATLSHDLKTPLTSIKAYAESLDKEMPKAEFATYRSVIIEKSDFIKQMLDDIITYTLLQSPEYKLELVEVEGEEFFEMILSDYEALCHQHDIKLHTINEATGIYFVNAKEMIRVADNLLINAIQHTRKHGTIWLAAISEEGSYDWLFDFVHAQFTFHFERYTYVIVQNEGDGIPEENVQLLFEPLYQVDKARSKKDAHGTGLGLSITKKIIEKHGGNITALSKPDIGACFICAIPKGVERDEKSRTIYIR